ncbi:MAG TPA: SDR family oxidoreductase [Candidatus Dormibacteraeota bacterium]|nr:SDR family oxidoreductase [Candidatus Dormibacteraeota bacterium]
MILITGASGHMGKAVLNEVVQLAAQTGEEYRAMYRSVAQAAKAPVETPTVIADFAKKDTLPTALHNVTSVYLVCSPVPQLIELEWNMIDACVAAGVSHIVLHSALGAREYRKSFPSWHRTVEDKLKSTKISFTILRPNSFHQNVLTYFAPSIRSQGVFRASMGNALVSFIDARDIAVIAAKSLSGGEHSGKTYELNGPEALSYSDLAAKISQHSGHSVQYVNIPLEEQRKAMLESGLPEWQADALLDLQSYYVKGKGNKVDNLLEQLLGRPPITMDQFLAEFANEFRPHPELRLQAEVATA